MDFMKIHIKSIGRNGQMTSEDISTGVSKQNELTHENSDENPNRELQIKRIITNRTDLSRIDRNMLQARKNKSILINKKSVV